MSDYNMMVLVVDRSSRRVLDCEGLDYSWKLDEVLSRHDFSKVDLVLRERTNTKPTAVAESFVNTDVEAPPEVKPDEDIPF